jgi:hypothetical protein
VILLAVVFSKAVFAETSSVPEDTPAWRVSDALEEFLDPRSTPLAREVAKRRLAGLRGRDWLEWAGPQLLPMFFDSDALEADPVAFRKRQQGAWGLFLKTDEDWARWYGARGEAAEWFKVFPLRAAQFPKQIAAYLVEAIGSNLDELENGTTARRYQAVTNLGRLGALASPAVGAIKKALKDSDAEVRDAAARALGTKEAARDALRGRWIEQLRDGDVRLREAAAMGLANDGFLKAPADKVVIAAMKGEQLGRVGLVRAMERSWREEIDLDQALARTMREANDPMGRLMTAIAMKIRAAGSADAKVYEAERVAIVDELQKRVARGKSASGAAALRKLAALGVKPAEMIDALSAAALSGDPELRYDASQLLIEAGEAGLAGWLALFD